MWEVALKGLESAVKAGLEPFLFLIVAGAIFFAFRALKNMIHELDERNTQQHEDGQKKQEERHNHICARFDKVDYKVEVLDRKLDNTTERVSTVEGELKVIRERKFH